MSSLEKLLKHERAVPYTFISTIFGVAGFVLAIYFSMFYEKSPKLDIELMSQFSALDIKESVDSLDVIYDNNSLNAQGMSLSVIELKVTNSGTAPILRSYYDPKSRAGFKINQGVIPEPPLVMASKTPYAHNDITIEKPNENSILLPHIVLNPKDYYTIKVIVLHDSSKKPIVSSFGVIAGSPKIAVLPNLVNEDNRTLLGQFFDGSIIMNLSRFFILGFLFFVVFILVLGTGIHLSEVRFKNRILNLIKQFKKCNSQRVSTVTNSFFTQLEKFEKSDFERYLKAIKSDSNYAFELYFEEFKSLGIIQVSDIGRRIPNQETLEVFMDFLHLLVEEKLIKEVVISKPETQDSLSEAT
ncbi:hypothetical protein MW651_004458 [Vibrio vulnificus]|nr:hypothetical protein [Vibrio vulnificus]